MLPPTSESLLDETCKPYFLWWIECTVGQLRQHLQSPDPAVRAYWLGALLREANSRDVWLFTCPEEIRQLWPHLGRYLGRARERWSWLLQREPTAWPPKRGADA